MQDLTQGSITRHLLSMAAFIGVGLIFQTLYYLVDLYFVARIGKEAVAGVSAAGSLFFLGMALTQLIGVGALALIAQATGRKDEADAELVYNQAMAFAVAAAVAALVLGYVYGERVLVALAADAPTARQGWLYLMGFLPSLALMFPATAMGSALRATGVVKPTMILQSVQVILNVILAPVLIAGLGTGVPLGAFGAGLASSIAVTIGFIGLLVVFPRVQKFIATDVGQWRPRLSVWGRIVAIGAPAAGEFALMFVVFGVVYYTISSFGATAQAGFGIGMRIMQSVFLPAMAVAFAAAPIAGQNFGAGKMDRVRETFRQSALIGSGIMAALTVLCLIRPDLLIAPFTQDPAVAEVGNGYLRVAALNFVAIGIVFACSGMFQALGDTKPALLSSFVRVAVFTGGALWLSTQPRPVLSLQHVWYLSAATITLQAVLSFGLLQLVFRKKLRGAPESAFHGAGAVGPEVAG
jgi:putative MATE family efflux protein